MLVFWALIREIAPRSGMQSLYSISSMISRISICGQPVPKKSLALMANYAAAGVTTKGCQF